MPKHTWTNTHNINNNNNSITDPRLYCTPTVCKTSIVVTCKELIFCNTSKQLIFQPEHHNNQGNINKR